jgi:two-component system, OmpR family, sensor histidine kinase BaeS
MLRSLRVRLLVASISIAVAAVAATAWLTSQGTASSVRNDVERALETDSDIYAQLWDYATSNHDWDGVDDLVRDLASSSGRRIALTTRSGRLIVDSAELEGRDARLPRRPAALVDPFEDGTAVYSGVSSDFVAANPFPLTEEELAARRSEAERGAECMNGKGQPAEVSVEGDWVSVDPPEDSSLDDDSWGDVYDGCVNDDLLYGMGAAELVHYNEEQQATRACLDAEGVESSTRTETDGSLTVEVDYDDPVASSAFDRCYEQALREVNDPLVADPALLYLGERDEPPSWQNAGGGRTLLAAGLVALITVALSVLVARRLLRPVAALTGAAQRMATGDLSERVDVEGRGRDEMAGLARAFNAMADAVETNEEQRRRMVSDVAHELRTPLANIRGYVEAAQDGVAPPDAALLESLHEETLLLQHLIDDLQVLSLAEADRLPLHVERLDLGELAEQVVAAYRVVAAGEDVELAVDRSASDATVDGDPVRLRQALGNLVANAVRYTPAGGRVTVEVGRDDGEVAVGVADTGIGISAPDLPHVFDRFWRADVSRARDTGGSGLGLAICRQLVQRHGGRVTATSVPGEGSTFTIHLPAAAGEHP